MSFWPKSIKITDYQNLLMSAAYVFVVQLYIYYSGLLKIAKNDLRELWITKGCRRRASFTLLTDRLTKECNSVMRGGQRVDS